MRWIVQLSGKLICPMEKNKTIFLSQLLCAIVRSLSYFPC